MDSEEAQEGYVTTVTSSGSGPGHFTVNNDDWQLTIKDDLGVVIYGPCGEGIPASAPGINSREVFKLEEDPSDTVDPVNSNYNDGTSSSFGGPNLWSAGTVEQDFRALRGLPVVSSTLPDRGSVVASLTSVSVTFSESVTGVAAGDLVVDGAAAAVVTGSGSGPYEFSGFVAPTEGLVAVVLSAGLIEDLDGHAFTGDAWGYTFDLPDIVINEIHYHPSVSAVNPGENEEDLQFLELYNADDETVDLSDWSISDGVDFDFPPSTTLDPGEYLLIAENAAFLDATIPDDSAGCGGAGVGRGEPA